MEKYRKYIILIKKMGCFFFTLSDLGDVEIEMIELELIGIGI